MNEIVKTEGAHGALEQILADTDKLANLPIEKLERLFVIYIPNMKPSKPGGRSMMLFMQCNPR